MIILGENFKWHLEAFASELFKVKCKSDYTYVTYLHIFSKKSVTQSILLVARYWWWYNM